MASENIQDEIKWLEEKLQSKKLELGTDTENKAEKELVKDILKEAPGADLPQITAVQSVSDDVAIKKAHDLEEKEHGEIVSTLVAEALSNGLEHAINTAKNMKNPHILDDFHDALADKYYEKLLEARKIKS